MCFRRKQKFFAELDTNCSEFTNTLNSNLIVASPSLIISATVLNENVNEL